MQRPENKSREGAVNAVRKGVFSLILSVAAGGFVLTAQNPSAESLAFLASAPADAQQKMTDAVRAALAGSFRPLNRIRESMRKDSPAPEGVRVQNSTLEGQRIRFYFPRPERGGAVLLYFHGGGWTIGSLEGSARFCGDLARRSGVDVATADYRLAPEHRAPAALEDALKAVRHLQTLGYRRIYLAGDSAGGNLAACAAGKLRSQIAGILLYYPVVLAKSDNSESWRKFGRGFGLDRSLMEAFNESYAPGTLAEDPSVSPLLAREFRRWPETWIAAAECDVLRDQGRAFADRLLREGVRVTWRLLPGTLHAFLTYPGMENAYRDGLQIALDFLNALEKNSMNTSSGEKIIRLSRIEVDPARIPEYLALVAECGRRSMAEEPGVEMMYSMQEKEHPERITILEIYADRAAYERHIRTPHFRTYKQRSLEMVRKLELLDQNPLVPEMKMK